MSEDAAGAAGARQDDSTARYGEEFAAQLAAHAPDLGTEAVAAIGALPSGSAILVVERGPASGSRFLLDTDSALAGRHPDAAIFLDDVTVSRRHAEFTRSGTVFTVRDLGSLNGTYVGGRLVDSAVLADGVDVQIGKFRLTFYASRLDLAGAEG
ncbi:MAG TPA: FHA domain-containing protein [Microbacteriaceae bacterium]|nr:FHA domain-containing protein [Microbacteriaceae bacterium]